MSLSVRIIFADNTLMEEGVTLQLLSGGTVVSIGITDDKGSVTFDVDPSTLMNPAINLAPRQTPPTNVVD